MKKTFIINTAILIILNTGSGAIAQDIRTVTGVVTAFNKIPLNKVKVSALKSGETVYTTVDGQFSIKTEDQDLLTISASGFSEKKIKIRKSKLYKIDLHFIFNDTNSDRAIKDGHITEDVLRQAVNTDFPGEGKDYSKYKTINELISSEIYNVRVKGNSIVNTKIRSFDSSPQVLYVVDKKVVTDISYIIPQYVKTIEFIDDVRTSAYGVMGANGVIKITLK